VLSIMFDSIHKKSLDLLVVGAWIIAPSSLVNKGIVFADLTVLSQHETDSRADTIHCSITQLSIYDSPMPI
jgi:hypothetical protein